MTDFFIFKYYVLNKITIKNGVSGFKIANTLSNLANAGAAEEVTMDGSDRRGESCQSQ